jgi:hypothetical protein
MSMVNRPVRKDLPQLELDKSVHIAISANFWMEVPRRSRSVFPHISIAFLPDRCTGSHIRVSFDRGRDFA